ncbi:MAG: transposase [Streptosporangiales bacterium]|nr:transposase [Streptosporangiales bacterium]
MRSWVAEGGWTVEGAVVPGSGFRNDTILRVRRNGVRVRDCTSVREVAALIDLADLCEVIDLDHALRHRHRRRHRAHSAG